MSIIHSVPEFLLEGKKVRLSFAVQDSVKSLTVTAGDKTVKAKKSSRSTPPRSKQKLPKETTFHIRSMPTARRLSIRLRSPRTAGFLLLR